MLVSPATSTADVTIIGAGPAGLMAAEVIASAGVPVAIHDAMPSVGRKFLLAGVGGLNITHSETKDRFIQRYGERRQEMARLLETFDADALRQWVHGLGIDTFVGSSGRVFPEGMKAAPLLRAWLRRLRERDVRIHTRQRWLGWDENGALRFRSEQGEQRIQSRACLLALGGGSWPKLGSDGSWVPLLRQRGIDVADLQPSNCGFDVIGWSGHLKNRFAGSPIKNIALTLPGETPRPGEFILTGSGVEGSLIYALSAPIRERINRYGQVTLKLDLLPQIAPEVLHQRLTRPRGTQSLARHLQRQTGLHGVKVALLHELAPAEWLGQPERLAETLKTLPLTLIRPRPLAEAISSAGGVTFAQLNENLMVRQQPGLFCAGEMLDWEAPTGGYLLTGCFASGYRAGLGILRWLGRD